MKNTQKIVLEQLKNYDSTFVCEFRKKFIEVPRKISSMEIQELREETSEGDGQK